MRFAAFLTKSAGCRQDWAHIQTPLRTAWVRLPVLASARYFGRPCGAMEPVELRAPVGRVGGVVAEPLLLGPVLLRQRKVSGGSGSLGSADRRPVSVRPFLCAVRSVHMARKEDHVGTSRAPNRRESIINKGCGAPAGRGTADPSRGASDIEALQHRGTHQPQQRQTDLPHAR